LEESASAFAARSRREPLDCGSLLPLLTRASLLAWVDGSRERMRTFAVHSQFIPNPNYIWTYDFFDEVFA
jgi:hypothetical protein